MSQVTHARAPLNAAGRAETVALVIEQGWPQVRLAERFGVHRSTVAKRVDRFRAQGEAGLADRCSPPRRSPGRTPARIERRILAIRFNRRWGAHRIACHLHLSQSAVSEVLARYRMPLLAHLDRAPAWPSAGPPQHAASASCPEPGR